MHECCSADAIAAPPKKCKCPLNGVECAEVSAQTIIHHIKSPWLWTEKNQGYYFCEDPTCDVAYFGEDGSVISKQELRGIIGIKDESHQSLICYCFGVSKADAWSTPSIRDYVIQKTKGGMCSCKTSNPSGRCCLKDFPHHEKR